LREEHRQRILENRVLRRIFGPNRDWRRLHNAEIHDLNTLPNHIRLMNSRRTRLTGHVARRDVHTRFWWGNLREGDHLEDLSIDWRIILT